MRQRIQNAIYNAFKEIQYVGALWIAGSAAFNRIDEYSDIDIGILALPEYNDEIFSTLDHIFNKIDKIKDCYKVPYPNLSGHHQRFYVLETASPFQFVDLSIIPPDKLTPILDHNRHGKPIILIDRFNKLKTYETPKEALMNFEMRIENLQNQFRVLSRILVEKAILRQRFAEAVSFYHTRVLQPLLEVLRAKYCPPRQDFGARYLQWDLPEDICKTLNQLYAISSFEDIKKSLEIAESLFWQTVRSLSSD